MKQKVTFVADFGCLSHSVEKSRKGVIINTYYFLSFTGGKTDERFKEKRF